MKITIAQINPIVGAIRGNLAQIERIIREHGQSTDLIIFPELSVVGYPPKDLLERDWFLAGVNRAIEELVELSREYPNTGILVGAPLATGAETGKGLSNSAILIYQGQVLANQPKSLLPTYDVFDEARHFDPAVAVKTVLFKGESLGITICEDAWNDSELWPGGRLYRFDPITALAAQGATLLINIAASPFQMGKDELRYQLISNHSSKHRLPMVFVNQVGGNDELIFDGGSMAVDAQGALLAQSPFFKEDVRTFATNAPAQSEPYQPLERVAAIYDALVLGTRDYLYKCGFKGAVIGLSGGVDSALTCCIAVEALGAENVLGIAMPSQFSSVGSVEDSRKLAENLSINFKIVPIKPIHEAYLNTLEPYFSGKEPDVTEENIQARIRGNILMAFSNKFGYLALSTGNKSELAVGYCTLYGDMSGGLSVIADVPKTTVYELTEYINRVSEVLPRAIIEKAPSAELRPNQCDQDTLPPYEILDQILYYYIEEGAAAADLIAKGFVAETVNWVIRAVDRSEYKRRQAAPGLKVTSKAFGMGRRLPIAKRIDF